MKRLHLLWALLAGALAALLFQRIVLPQAGLAVEAVAASEPDPTDADVQSHGGHSQPAPRAPLLGARGLAARSSANGITLTVVLATAYQPIEPLFVRILHVEQGLPAGPEARTLERATWAGLDPGRYRVEASGEGWNDASEEIELSSGQSPSELALEVQAREWIGGQVLDRQTGQPISEYHIAIVLSGRLTNADFGVRAERELQVHPSPDGRFALAGIGVQFDSVLLTFDSEGYVSETIDVPASSRVDNLTVYLESNELGESSVHGRIALSGSDLPAHAKLTLVDPGMELDGAILDGGEAVIFTAHDVTGDASTGGARTETDESGAFRLATRFEGSARLLIVPRDLAGFLSEPFELRHGTDLDLGTLGVPPGGTIEGRVWRGDLARPDEQRMISLERPGGPIVTSALDAEDGFRFAGLPPGLYEVRVTARTTGSDGKLSGDLILTTEHVVLAAMERVYLDLHCGSGGKGQLLQGRVVSLEDPMEWRVGLYATGPIPEQAATVERDGSFVLPDVPEGSYLLVAAGRNLETARFALSVRSLRVPADTGTPLLLNAGTSRVELRSGEVRDVPFDVVGNARVPLVQTVLDELLFGAHLDGEGRAILRGLPEGTYSFRVSTKTGQCSVPASGGVFRVDL